MAKPEEVDAADPDTEAERIVADAEEAAREAESLLSELERRVESGDASVTREAVEAAERDRNWLQKLVAGAKSRANDVREGARQSKLAALRKDIEAQSLSSGDFGALLANVEEAAKAFALAFRTRNSQIAFWRQQAESLGVGDMGGRLVPAQKDGGIALVGNGDLQVGDRVFRSHYSGRILTSLLHALAESDDWVPYYRDVSSSPISGLQEVRAAANVEHESQAVPLDALFFRRIADGHVFRTGPENGFSVEVQKRDGLVEISREEALNE